MRRSTSGSPLRLALLVCLSAPSLVSAQTNTLQAAPTSRQLSGLGIEEADTLIAKLSDAQRRLRDGKFQRFELLSGSASSYEATKISPRDAFLQVRFGSVWSIERVKNQYLRSYRLAYAPEGLGKLYWDIEVALGSDGEFERVAMVYRAPAPY